MTTAITPIELAARIRRHHAPGRMMVALAGAPGSGKSTLAERLAARLNEVVPDSAAVLAMDGYHFDDRVLEACGSRARKGAPDTFDVAGLHHMLARLKLNAERTRSPCRFSIAILRSLAPAHASFRKLCAI